MLLSPSLFLAIARDLHGFSKAIKLHLKKYNNESNLAFENRDWQKGQVLFDSLVANYLIGTTFEDYTLKSFEKKN